MQAGSKWFRKERQLQRYRNYVMYTLRFSMEGPVRKKIANAEKAVDASLIRQERAVENEASGRRERTSLSILLLWKMKHWQYILNRREQQLPKGEVSQELVRSYQRSGDSLCKEGRSAVSAFKGRLSDIKLPIWCDVDSRWWNQGWTGSTFQKPAHDREMAAEIRCCGNSCGWDDL